MVNVIWPMVSAEQYERDRCGVVVAVGLCVVRTRSGRLVIRVKAWRVPNEDGADRFYSKPAILDAMRRLDAAGKVGP